MTEPAPGGDITSLLQRAGHGDAAAHEALMNAVYHELKRLSRAQRRDDANDTLDTTGLVHEAWLKLAGTANLAWPDRHRFFAYAARAMRTVLVDKARSNLAVKRGAQLARVPLEGLEPAAPDSFVDLLALHEILEKVEAVDPRLGEIVELHVFAGMRLEDIAGGLGVSERTVYRAWGKARAMIDVLLRGEA